MGNQEIDTQSMKSHVQTTTAGNRHRAPIPPVAEDNHPGTSSSQNETGSLLAPPTFSPSEPRDPTVPNYGPFISGNQFKGQMPQASTMGMGTNLPNATIENFPMSAPQRYQQRRIEVKLRMGARAGATIAQLMSKII